MTITTSICLRTSCASVALLTLSACGGAGSGTVTSAPPPITPPTSSDDGSSGNAGGGSGSQNGGGSSNGSGNSTDTGSVDYNTAEYQASDGAVFHNAVTAWRSGADGDGIAIAVIDSGIDADSPEFTGRILAASRDVVSGRSIDNPTGTHGTHVATIAAAGRNDRGVVGVAWNADILAVRADTPGSCGDNGNCTFNDANIAAGIDYAVASGARIINLSLGGGTPAPDLRRAVADAARAGVVIVVAAGNEGGRTGAGVDPSSPTALASGLMQSADGHVIIVGSVDNTGTISDFSNRAGYAESSYIAARGENLCCEYVNGSVRQEGGSVWHISGTSFAAPQVAGAAALLAQAFPNLTGREIVQILLTSARDAGSAGTDDVYGWGILDIASAFAPSGKTKVAGTSVGYKSTAASGQTSTAMGDAIAGASLPTLITDQYDRAYSVDMAANLRTAPQRPKLGPALANRGRQSQTQVKGLALAFTIAPSFVSAQGSQDGLDPATASQTNPYRVSPLDAQRLGADNMSKARLLAARASLALDKDTALAFALGTESTALLSDLQDRSSPSFLLSNSNEWEFGTNRPEDRLAFAMRRKLGRWGLTLAAERTLLRGSDRQNVTDFLQAGEPKGSAHRFALSADRTFGPIKTALSVSLRDESQSVLGAHLTEPWGNPGAQTLAADIAAQWQIAPRWRMGGAWQYSQTRVDRTGLIQTGSRLGSQSWSIDIERIGLFSTSDRLALQLSQPLRVNDGGLMLLLPNNFDYATETAQFGSSFLSLAPDGREQRAELRWNGRLLGGAAAASLFWRKEPGHYSGAAPDGGIAFQWQREF